jgi:2-succinyl-5-enolpyruvyl-6-hydroxy-3-cyclohexene-1-carboxylate synthase
VVVPADPDLLMEALIVRADGAGSSRPARSTAAEWSEGWARAEAAAQGAIEGVLARHSDATEPGVARSLFAWSPPGSTIVTSSSMPVRDLEWFAAPRPDPPRVLANRGANGIDGVSSTTLGVAAAAAGTGGPVVGLLGDLAFLHDLTALVRGRREPIVPAVLVVLDNGGGGIFSFLSQASELDEASFERLFGTPQRIDVADLARAAGCNTIEIESSLDVAIQLDVALSHAARRGPAVVVVRTDRKANVALHTELEAEVALSLG